MNTENRSRSTLEFGNYLQELLTAVASIFLAVYVVVFCLTFRSWSARSQTGLTAVAGGILEAAVSGWLWVVFVPCFTWLFAARRASRNSVRVVLFWVPALGAVVLGIAWWLAIVVLLRHVPAQ